jgi:hypothetical protein
MRRLGIVAVGLALVVLMTGCMWGVVTDVNTGAPVPGATVSYTDSQGRSGTATTDANGLYAFDSASGPIPAVGPASFVVSAGGYDTVSTTRELAYDDNASGTRANPSSMWEVQNFSLAAACVSALTTYHNEQFGFEFQYCSECTLTEQSEGAHNPGGGEVYLWIIVGSRLEVYVSDSGGLSLTDYVSQVTAQLEAGGASIGTVMPVAPVGGADAVTVQYRFGGLGRYGEATFFMRNGLVYDVEFTAGAFTCNEPQVYRGILSTFRFGE